MLAATAVRMDANDASKPLENGRGSDAETESDLELPSGLEGLEEASASDAAGYKNGRYRTRTCDPLRVKQVL